MRTYKFRAWDKEQKRMLTDEFMNVALFASIDVTFNHVADLEIMQFTGLLDKTGHEIYEGDILKWHDQIIQVVWERNYFMLSNITRQTTVMVASEEHLEIIGNIYETPELLKQALNP